MPTSVEPGSSPLVFPLAGELDSSDTGWSDELDAALDRGARRLVVDLLDVSFVDSSVVQWLVLAHKQVGDSGWVRVVYTHHLIKRVIEICGLAELFPQYSSIDAALRAAPSKVASARAAVSGDLS